MRFYKKWVQTRTKSNLKPLQISLTSSLNSFHCLVAQWRWLFQVNIRWSICRCFFKVHNNKGKQADFRETWALESGNDFARTDALGKSQLGSRLERRQQLQTTEQGTKRDLAVHVQFDSAQYGPHVVVKYIYGPPIWLTVQHWQRALPNPTGMLRKGVRWPPPLDHSQGSRPGPLRIGHSRLILDIIWNH